MIVPPKKGDKSTFTRRVGRILISHDFLREQNIEGLVPLFRTGIVPFRIVEKVYERAYEMWCYWSEFPEIPEGSAIPLYDIDVTFDGVDHTFRVYCGSETAEVTLDLMTPSPRPSLLIFPRSRE